MTSVLCSIILSCISSVPAGAAGTAHAPARVSATLLRDAGPLRVFDAVGNGSADDPAPLQSAEEWSRTTAGASMVWLDAGSYRLKGTVYNPSGSLWLVPPGASVSGGLLEGNTDGSAISPHHEGLALISNATTAGGSALFVSRNFSKPSPFGAYESDGLYISVATSDPSNLAYHDMVAGHFAAQISVGNDRGRSWGEDVTVTVPAGSDGYAVGEEISIGNNSGSTGAYGEVNAKLGLALLAAGTTDSTAAILVHDAGARFHDGILAFTTSVTHSLFRLTDGLADRAAVYADGSAVFGKTVFTGPVRLPRLSVADLPSSCLSGEEVYALDGRNPRERRDAGTGTTVFCNNKGRWLSTASGLIVGR